MSQLDTNVVIWRLEYFLLHKMASDNSISVKHNNNVGDLGSVRRLLYSLVRKVISELFISPISTEDGTINDSISKSHGDLSFELVIDPTIINPISHILRKLREEEDQDLLAFEEALADIEDNNLIRLDRVKNKICFNVGKSYVRGRVYTIAPHTHDFFTQCLILAPIWQRLRVKIQEQFNDSSVAKQLAESTSGLTSDSPLENFKAMLEARKSKRDSQ